MRLLVWIIPPACSSCCCTGLLSLLVQTLLLLHPAATATHLNGCMFWPSHRLGTPGWHGQAVCAMVGTSGCNGAMTKRRKPVLLPSPLGPGQGKGTNMSPLHGRAQKTMQSFTLALPLLLCHPPHGTGPPSAPAAQALPS